jgi:predicted DNA-binding transcriptional regulator
MRDGSILHKKVEYLNINNCIFVEIILVNVNIFSMNAGWQGYSYSIQSQYNLDEIKIQICDIVKSIENGFSQESFKDRMLLA